MTLATLTAIIGYFNRFLRIDMTSSMAILFKECEGGGSVFDLCQYGSFPIHKKLSKTSYIGLLLNGVYQTRYF